MSDSIGSGTVQGVIDYLDSLVEKGRSRQGVIAPLKIALTKVLQKTEGEDWEKVDVAKLDVDDAIARFKNLTLGTYTDSSYRAYELRTKRAISWYKHFLTNPGWFPKESIRSANFESYKQTIKSNDSTQESTTKAPRTGIPSPHASANISDQAGANSTEYESPKTDAIAYPFPLQGGETARIYMPKSVKKSDIVRLTTFLEALVIEKDAG